jgi:vitamin B12 transporter
VSTIATRNGARLALVTATVVAVGAQVSSDPAVELPQFAVYSPRVAVQEPSGTFAMPVTALRYEPLVDVQARNLAEGQADIAIRGGIFENAGFRLGGVILHDPQTGHYSAEIPVTPAMISAPRILTGVDNSMAGFNASVGTVAFDWQRIRTRGELAIAAGGHDFYRVSLYEGRVSEALIGGRALAADVEFSRSASDGSVPFGDHRFRRSGVRLQLAGHDSQTDLFYGDQAKFYGWPNLYTPFGSDETENLQTVLVALNHRRGWAPAGWFEASAFWRRLKDDYAFNRFAPVGPVHPFQHTTWTKGLAFTGHDDFGAWALGWVGETVADDLKSTSLTYGRFHSRAVVKLGLAPEKTWTLGPRDRLILKTGATYDDTNREASAISPFAELQHVGTSNGGVRRAYFSYAESTQVPTYTALNSNAASGLFRGNPNLTRSTSHNIELGGDCTRTVWQSHVAVFYRRDDQLVDWTFRHGIAARTANPVDVETLGAEAVLKWNLPGGEIVLGYGYLHKNADYGSTSIDASFYALNFPTHRLTIAVTRRFAGGFELRMDNEARLQKDNPLRTAGGNRAVISSLGLVYRPPRTEPLEFSLQVDNLWNADFQEVPAVPAARRQVSAGMTCRW